MVPRDTSPAVHSMMIERWRALSFTDRADLVDQLCSDCDVAARTGIALYGAVSVERERWLLMSRRYGRSFAVDVLGPEPAS